MAYLSETGLAYFWKKAREKLYPVGTVYQTLGDTNPSELFGGTWGKISSHASHTFTGDDVFVNSDKIVPRLYDDSYKMTFSGDVVNVTARFKLQIDSARDSMGKFQFSKWFSNGMPELYVHGVVEDTGEDAGSVMTFKIDPFTGEISVAGSNYYNAVYINLAFTFVVPGLVPSNTFNKTYGNGYTLWKRKA